MFRVRPRTVPAFAPLMKRASKRPIVASSRRECLRSSAGHLTEQSGALGTGSLRRHGLGRRVRSGGRSSMGGGRSSLLGLRGRSGGGRARRSAADGSLTRHFESGCEGCCSDMEVLLVRAR